MKIAVFRNGVMCHCTSSSCCFEGS